MISGLPYDVINKVPMTRFEGLAGSKLYLINTPSEWQAFYALLMKRKIVACDTETEGFNWFHGERIVGLSFGWGDTHFYVPLRHVASASGGEQPPQLEFDYIREDLRAFFAQDDVFTLWHNWKFDAHFYRADGIEILTPFHDTRILWQLYDENAPGALKTIASGWKDMDGNQHQGLVGPEANEKERELDAWRANEAKTRRDTFRALVMARADELKTAIEHQDKSRTQLKSWIIKNELKDHKYANACKADVHYGYVPAQLMVEYAATDTFLTYTVYDYVVKNLQMDEKLQALYVNEIKLSRALMEAEHKGIKVDRPYLVQLKADLEREIMLLEARLKCELGAINLGSNLQLAEALINYGIPLTGKTKAGRLAVDKKAISKLNTAFDSAINDKRLKHLEFVFFPENVNLSIEEFRQGEADLHKGIKCQDVLADVISLREANKILNTYVIGILDKLTPDDILHCSFNQNVSTGRMSASNPNLQNIPGRDNRIRKAFIGPGDDYVYVFADYSQVEVRLTAHYSKDPLLLDSYEKGQDVHTRTTCEMFGLDYAVVDEVIKSDDPSHPKFKEWKNLRNIAKRINFGIIYGVGAPGLSEQIPRPPQYAGLDDSAWIAVCQDYIDQYLDKYFMVKRFIRASGRDVKKHGIVHNHFGRPRRLPNGCIKDKKYFWKVGRAQRQGTNFLIQGTAADVFKVAVVRVFEILRGTKSFMVNFVHDEIQAYIHRDELHLLNELKQAMEDFDFIVPIIADFAWSQTNWAAKRELG